MANEKPTSHFFVDYTNLTNSIAANSPSDAFGPVSTNPTNEYRVTSFVRADSSTKVLAICEGQIMIQPQTEDSTKVNLILKPAASAVFSPIKIKYFIYRGINKSDLINNDVLEAVNTSDPTQPFFLQKLWKEFVDFNMPFYDQGIIDTPPNTFPAFLIGYDENQSGETLIEHYFRRNSDDQVVFYQIPACKRGEHIGNFTGRIGLDVVLDYGDYALTNQDELFRLDLNFARKEEHIFNLTDIQNSTPTKIKRYKEYIHQFIDAAAFWGAHIDSKIIMPGSLTSTPEIFTNILNKYQTKNKLYFYIQAERARSYNYYDSNRKVHGIEATPISNYTNGWPIIIKEKTFSGSNNTIDIGLEYFINSGIDPQRRSVSLSLIISKNDLTIYPKRERPVSSTGSIQTGSIILSVNATKSCANFAFLFSDLEQNISPAHYFNDLWLVNVEDIQTLPTDDGNLVHWLSYDRNPIKNLDDNLNLSATLQQKVIFDNGVKQDVIGPNPPSKRRRTYLIGLKNNVDQNELYTTKNFTSGFENLIQDINTYSLKLYNEYNYIHYKGKFTDNQTSGNINCLALFHNENYKKKYCYFQLGITEEEFNKLIYDSPVVPPALPYNYPPQILPRDADNIFFYLDEVSGFSVPNVKKYKLGLQYEDNTGALQILYPSAANTVYVYTIDGYFYCSSEYAEYQSFSKDFPKCKAEFRITQPYSGQFGFDWMRIGDTGAPGDVNYKTLLGKLYSDSAHNNIEMNTNTYTGYFLNKPEMYNRLELEYTPFPMQYNSNNIEKYYVPSLSIYPLYTPPIPPTPDLDRQPIFTPPYDDSLNRIAMLTVKINITVEPVKLELEFDNTKLMIPPTVLPKTVGNHIVNINVECKAEFGTEQLIKVKAYYNDSLGDIVGILRVKPNHKDLRRSKKLLLIRVRTNISGTAVPPSLTFTIEEQAKYLKKFLRQTLSTPIFEEEEIDLILHSDPTFNSEFIGTDISGSKFIKTRNTANVFGIKYLYDYLTTTGPSPVGTTKYADYFKIFFFNDKGDGLAGYAVAQLNLLADYPNPFPSTSTHEFLHTANVQHTFANYEGSEYALFTYKPLFTDNMMDYSDVYASPPISTISVFDWQSEIAKRKFDPEP